MDADEAKQDAEKEAADWLKAQEAELNQRYERELMNPREALSPRLDLRDRHARPTCAPCSAATSTFLLRHYEPGPMAGAAAGVPLMSTDADGHADAVRPVHQQPAHPPRPPARRVAVGVGALLRLRRHEAS